MEKKKKNSNLFFRKLNEENKLNNISLDYCDKSLSIKYSRYIYK